MAVLPVVKYPDPILRVKCKRVSQLDSSLQTLVDNMIDTLHDEQGAGLAAPQVGVPLRIIVVEMPEDSDHPLAGQPIALYNPEIIKSSGEWEPDEGCLSIPGWVGQVKRAQTVTVRGRDRKGKEVRYKADGLLGQAFQHEIDHLDGVLFIDRVDPDKLQRVRPEREEAGAGVER